MPARSSLHFSIALSRETAPGDTARFAVLATRIDFFDWLMLSINGHRRAQFLWKNGNWCGEWVAP